MYSIGHIIAERQIIPLLMLFLSQIRTMLIPPTFLEISGMRFLITGVGYQTLTLGR